MGKFGNDVIFDGFESLTSVIVLFLGHLEAIHNTMNLNENCDNEEES